MTNSAGGQESASKPGEYVVVARRYRPQSFEDLIGQGQVAQALTTAITTHRVGHAYLFTGARGVGKTSTARIFAKALNCVRGPTPTPCNECDICRSVSTGEDMDVLEIDGASNRGIDEIRQLRSNVSVRPSRARFKIYIIDEVHMLTLQAFNALLKTLEEPPEHVKFIFCTTDPEKIPITILSRCQRFDFPPVEARAIVERLRQIVQSEGRTAEEEALELLARRANGSMRDSQSLLEQLLSSCPQHISAQDVHAMLGTARTGQLAQVVQQLANRDVAGVFQEVDRALREGVDAGQLAEQLVGYLRDIMAATVDCGPEFMLHTSAGDYASLQEIGRTLGLETMLAMVQILDHAVNRMRHSAYVRVLLEVALVRICQLENMDDLSELIAQLRQGDSSSAGRAGAGSAGTRAASMAGSPAVARSGSAGQPTAPPSVAEAAPPSAEKKTDPANGLARNDGAPRTAATIAAAAPAANPPSSPPATQSVQFHSTEGGRVPAPHLDAEALSDESPPAAGGLSSENVEQIWKAALDTLADMTADFARHAERLVVAGPQRLVAQFGPGYILHKESCERPERRAKLEEALSRAAGFSVRLELELLSGDAAKPLRPQPPVSARQKQREKEQHPLVRRAIELFEAEVVRVDEPRERMN